MFADFFFSTSFILWGIGAVVVVSLFFGVINRRRASLVDVLRGYVERYQDRLRKAAKEREASED